MDSYVKKQLVSVFEGQPEHAWKEGELADNLVNVVFEQSRGLALAPLLDILANVELSNSPSLPSAP